MASYKLEQGCSLGLLEQMVGSQTIGNTIATQFSLRSFNIYSLLLFITWCLSPLASQAALLVVSRQRNPIPYPCPVYYYFDGNKDGWDTWEGQGFANTQKSVFGPSLDLLYGMLLATPTAYENSTMDIWGNVRIPDLAHLAANSTKTNAGWYEIQKGANLTYSSLLGIPVSRDNGGPLWFKNIGKYGWDRWENSLLEFSFKTSYLSLGCQEDSRGNYSDHEVIAGNISFIGNRDRIISSQRGVHSKDNIAQRECLENPIGSSAPNKFFGASITNSTLSLKSNGFAYASNGRTYCYLNNNSTWPARTLVLGFLGAPQRRQTCSLTTTYVDARVICEGKNCRVSAIRPSPDIVINRNLTNLSFKHNFNQFAKYFEATSIGYSARDPSPTESYILFRSGSEVVAADTGIRIQQLLNTIWFGAYDTSAMMGGFSSQPFVDPSRWNFYTAQVNGTNQIFVEVYRCHWPWLVILVVATTVMSGATAISIVLEGRICGPDLLGYVSSLVRTTPYVYGGFARSNLSGIERSRVLFSLKLRLLDVKSNSNLGFIAITNDGYKGGRLNEMEEGRLFY